MQSYLPFPVSSPTFPFQYIVLPSLSSIYSYLPFPVCSPTFPSQYPVLPSLSIMQPYLPFPVCSPTFPFPFHLYVYFRGRRMTQANNQKLIRLISQLICRKHSLRNLCIRDIDLPYVVSSIFCVGIAGTLQLIGVLSLHFSSFATELQRSWSNARA
jgi:hypothetical protein